MAVICSLLQVHFAQQTFHPEYTSIGVYSTRRDRLLKADRLAEFVLYGRVRRGDVITVAVLNVIEFSQIGYLCIFFMALCLYKAVSTLQNCRLVSKFVRAL